MAMVVEAFLSAAIQELIKKMASHEVVHFIKGKKLNNRLLKKMEIMLLSANAVLDDAEEKQITNQNVKKWLDELKDAIYDAEDMLDKISTEALQCKLDAEPQSHAFKAWDFISSLSPLNMGVNLKLKEILERLEYIAKQKDILGLKEGIGEKSSRRLPATSLVDESGIYGRDADKEALLKLVLSDGASGDELGVIAIVGMGGVGKTTLAQLVYNDSRVKDCFDIRTWACVSEEFDVFRVTKTILEDTDPVSCSINDLNQLQVRLKDRFAGRKFLLILDDVWNENHIDWEILKGPLNFGANGSKIIVTTRNESVASIMRTVPTYHLKQLTDDDCWFLFAKYAFGTGDSRMHPNLEGIGREIVKRCKGLPLAAKALGGLLRSKHDPEEWDAILKSNIWELTVQEHDILPALRLSYHYLPSHLKQCFAYCSLFPKDYKFDKEQLVLLWKAEGLLDHPKRCHKMEKRGDRYFHELVSRSFFEQSSGNKSYFIMHDLINDLAKFVSGEFCSSSTGDNSWKVAEKTRHLSYFRTGYDASDNFGVIYVAKHLRTFLPGNSIPSWMRYGYVTSKVIYDLLPRMRCLRVLCLSQYDITVLPDSIGNLKHLRYLDLSKTLIERLPKTVCTLYNLQTLLLFECQHLMELPRNIGRLVNLSHLDIRKTKLEKMPPQVGKLRNLQTLTAFVLGKHHGSSIKELRQFRHLRGTLSIVNLQNVIHAQDALEANMKDKKYLKELVLSWGEEAEAPQEDIGILDLLRPHRNLKHLEITNFRGTKFPDWLGDRSFSNIVSIRLSKCKYCSFLPPLGQLRSLKDLSIQQFSGVARVGPEFCGSGTSSAIRPFVSLRVLRFEEMLEWQEWCPPEDDDERGAFPHLQELYVVKCPRLTKAMPGYLPSLRKLEIKDCQELAISIPRVPAIRQLQLVNSDKVLCEELPYTLHNLRIEGCQALSSQLAGMMHCSTPTSLPWLGFPIKLKSLHIGHCDTIEFFPLELFCKLTCLKIYAFQNLKFLCASEGPCHTSLVSLEIRDCPNFVSFPHSGLPFSNLKWIRLVGCKNLKSLPEGMVSFFPSLEHLGIECCPELESFSEGGLPSKLSSLSIWDCEKLVSGRQEWGLQKLPCLTFFSIRGTTCRDVESFPEKALLPSTLTTLWIDDFPNLKFLDSRGLQLLTCLRDLWIYNCPKLVSMPANVLPASLSILRIEKCASLGQRCQKKKGKDWPKISHIPTIVIDKVIIT